MKKYLLGLMAVIMAVAFSSFTKIHYSSVFFVFIGDVTSQASVENTANYIQGDDQGCGGSNKACEVIVDSGNVTPNIPATLQNETSGITLAGTFHSSSGTYSISIATGIASAVNQN